MLIKAEFKLFDTLMAGANPGFPERGFICKKVCVCVCGGGGGVRFAHLLSFS